MGSVRVAAIGLPSKLCGLRIRESRLIPYLGLVFDTSSYFKNNENDGYLTFICIKIDGNDGLLIMYMSGVAG